MTAVFYCGCASLTGERAAIQGNNNTLTMEHKLADLTARLEAQVKLTSKIQADLVRIQSSQVTRQTGWVNVSGSGVWMALGIPAAGLLAAWWMKRRTIRKYRKGEHD